MITFKSVAELEVALRSAEAMHKRAEENGLDDRGNWPRFYAIHMAAWVASQEELAP